MYFYYIVENTFNLSFYYGISYNDIRFLFLQTTERT
jgi:hypothetical protein